MKSMPGPVVFLPRNPVAATLVVGAAKLVLMLPKKAQDKVVKAIRSIRNK